MRRVFSLSLISIVLFNVFSVQNTAMAASAPMISTWEVDNRSTLNNERVISKSSYKISAIYPSNVINVQGAGFPGYRGPGQMVVYKQNFGRTTGTNEFGKEAVVENGKVVKLTGANSLIPKNGYVISGHGSAKKWITNNLKIGTNIIIDEENKTFNTLCSTAYFDKGSTSPLAHHPPQVVRKNGY